MAASAHAFATRRIGITQSLFANPDRNGGVALPPTRRHLLQRSDVK